MAMVSRSLYARLASCERLSNLNLPECRAQFSAFSWHPALSGHSDIQLAVLLVDRNIMKGFRTAILNRLHCMIYCPLLEGTSHYTEFLSWLLILSLGGWYKDYSCIIRGTMKDLFVPLISSALKIVWKVITVMIAAWKYKANLKPKVAFLLSYGNMFNSSLIWTPLQFTPTYIARVIALISVEFCTNRGILPHRSNWKTGAHSW